MPTCQRLLRSWPDLNSVTAHTFWYMMDKHLHFWCHPRIRMAPMNFSSNVLISSSKPGSKIWPKKPPTRWSASRHSTDHGTTSFRKALQKGNLEHSRPSNDFPWYSFLALPSWLVNRSSRFGFRDYYLLGLSSPVLGEVEVGDKGAGQSG